MKRLFTLLCFALLTVSARAVVQSPYVLPVNFSCRIGGVGNCIFTVFDATGTNPQVAKTTYTLDESPMGTAYLVPGIIYTAWFQASGLNYYGLSFIAPDGYAVYINGAPMDLFSYYGSPASLAVYTVQLVPIASTVRVDAGTFSGISLGKAVAWDVGLGGLNNGASAGRILFKQLDLLVNPPSSRASLFFNAPPSNGQINVIYDGASYTVLRQVMTPQTMADLVDDGSGGYYIKFYGPSQVSGAGTGNVPYTINSGQNPWRTIHVTGTSQLLIMEVDNPSGTSLTRVSSLAVTSGSIASGNFVLTLQEGDGSTWLRTTTHTSTLNTDGTRDDVVVVNPPGAGSSVAAKTKFHYVNIGGQVTGTTDTCNYNSLTAPFTVTPSASLSFTVNVTNTGTNTWGSNHFISLRDGGGTPVAFASISGVAPGGNATVTLYYTAPGFVGSYNYTIQGLDNYVAWFPKTMGVTFNVASGSSSSGTTDTCNYNSTTFPLTLRPGATVSFSTNVTNTGTNTWNSNNYLVLRDGGYGNLSFASLSGISPGGSTNATLTITTPITPGSYTYHLQGLDNGVTWFPYDATVILNVIGNGWGEEIGYMMADPDTTQLTTTFTYYTDPSAFGNYRKIQSITQPTGNWSSFVYYDDWARRGQLQTESHPFVNTPGTVQAASLAIGNSSTYDYMGDYSGRSRNPASRVDAATNIQTGQRSTSYTLGSTRYASGQTYTIATATDYGSASLTQQTYTEVLDPVGSDPNFYGQPLCVKRPDQSEDSYAYYYGTLNGSNQFVSGSGAFFATVVWHGTTSSTGANSFTSSSMYSGATISQVYLVPYKSTMEVIVRNAAGLVVDFEKWVNTGSGSFSLAAHDTYTYNTAGQLLGQVHDNNTMLSNTYPMGLLGTSTDASGVETDFTYDSLHRVATTVKKGAGTLSAYITAGYTYPAQADIITTRTYDGANNVTQQVVSSGTPSVTTTFRFDPAGRQIQRIDNYGSANSLTTGYSYSSGGLVATVTLPGGAYKTTTTNLDGQLSTITGNAEINQSVSYWIDSGTGYHATQPIIGGVSAAWTNIYSDWLGRKVQEWHPEWDGNAYAHQWYYNSSGQLYKYTQPGQAATLYTYDTLGAKFREGLDLNANGSLDLASSDRITDYNYNYFLYGTAWALSKTTSVYAQPGVATATVISTEHNIYQLPTGRLEGTHYIDQFGNTTSKTVDVVPGNKVAVTTVSYPDSSTAEQQIAYNGLSVEAKDKTGVTMRYEYDALGRKYRDIDPRTGTTTTAYITGTNLVSSITDPASITQVTYTYDAAGRTDTVTNGLGKVAHYGYDTYNRKVHAWGDTEYPVEYGFDSCGRMTTQSTYRAGSGWTGSSWPTGTTGTADTTTWTFHAATGLLQTKTDASSHAVTYAYTIARQLYTRTWMRGVVTTYGYDANTGEQTSITYSASTPNVAYTYNRLGLVAAVTDQMAHTFTYNLTGTLELQSESFPTGLYGSGRQINYTYGSSGMVGRPTGFGIGTSGSPTADQSVTYGYGSDGRMNAFSGNAAGATSYTFNYGYQTNSHLVSQVYQGTTGLNDYRLFDPYHDWTSYRVVQVGSTLEAQFGYSFNNLGRISHVDKTGAVFSHYGNGTQGLTATYGYDDRSQVTSEQTKLGGSSTVLTGRDDSYGAYDNLGNRSTVTHNGNTATYTTNLLNQFTQRTVPGIFDVAGSAASGATVTVNSSSSGVTRHGDYFFKGQPLSNNPNAAYSTLAVSDGTTTTSLPAYLAGTPESFTYDYDGNLTLDGRWSYQYDGENRVKWIETSAAAITAGVTKAGYTFCYDYLGRRVQKIVYSWSGSAWVQQAQERYLYNGWNQIATYDSTPTLTKSYFWGMDIGGAGQTAGGIGALLMIQDTSQTYMPVYDAMGNVHGLIKASDGSLAAAYEYDAFGNTLRMSGPYATSNPFRFSTKFTDDETGLVYYGRRYYSPSQGRFLGRDPIEEKGGLHLYAFCRNNAVNGYDYLGMLGGAEIIAYDGGADTSISEQQARMQAIIDARRAGSGFDDSALWNGTSDADKAAAKGEARRAAEIVNESKAVVKIGTLEVVESPDNAPNNAANPAAVTTVQLLGRQVDGAPSGDLHGALLISGDGQALVVSAQPSAKISGWTQIKNLAGVDVGITISPQTPSAPGSSGEFAKYQSSTTHDASPVFIVNQSFNQTVTQINTFNDAVRSQGVPYLTRTQNSNSYAFTLLQVITQQPYSGSSSYYGAGTWIPTPAAPKPPAAPQPAQPSHNP
jgi:RHS repeat-associated protein